MIINYIANTKKHKLYDHLNAVSGMAGIVYDRLGFNNSNIREMCKQAGLCHDIGKLCMDFQSWCAKKNSDEEECFGRETSKKKFDDLIRHNELSWAALKCLNLEMNNETCYAVFWHHAKKYRNNSNAIKDLHSLICKYGEKEFEDYLNRVAEFLKKNFGLAVTKKYEAALECENVTLPNFKEYGNQTIFRRNVVQSIVRLCLVVADRIVSSLTAEELESLDDDKFGEILNQRIMVKKSNLSGAISDMVKYFDNNGDSNRNKVQCDVAKRCFESKNNSIALQGPAGVGKTKIALQWAGLYNSNQIVFVCPRVSVCQGLYDEISTKYLPGASVQIYTGAHKYVSKDGNERELSNKKDGNKRELSNKNDEFLDADVVITTIDQISSIITNHARFDLLAKLQNSVCIFDEFHEIMQVPAMSYFLKEFLAIRASQSAKNLLMSATPNPILLKFLLSLNDEYEDNLSLLQRDYIISIKSYHDRPYNVEIKEFSSADNEHPFFTEDVLDNSILISNKIRTAQQGFLRELAEENNKKSLVVHSMYTKKDKKIIMDAVFKNFGEKKDKRVLHHLRAGPILQASLNISAKHISSDVTSPEDLLQRLGRCNRFCEHDEGNFSIIAEKKGQKLKKNKYLTKAVHAYESSSKFMDYIVGKYGRSFRVSLDQIYADYFKFYSSSWNDCKKDFDQFKKEGLDILKLNNYFEPIDFFMKKSKKKNNNKLASKSIRGSSIYVIPTKTVIVDNKFKELGWLYDPKKISGDDSFITMGVDDYRLKDILKKFEMRAKHYNQYYPGGVLYTKYNSNRHFIFKMAKEPDFGIFIGDLDGPNSRELEMPDDFNFTYIFQKSHKGEIISIGLINKFDITKS